jgi:hypothetical protein
MSLTSFLRTDGKELFDSLPDVKDHWVLCKGPLATDDNRLVTPRHAGADPAFIGTAYDFCCRALVQKLNGQPLEEQLSPVIDSGLRSITHFNMMSDKEWKKLAKEVENIWQARVDFINGSEMTLDALAHGALRLAYVEQAYRSGRLMQKEWNTQENRIDLINLMKSTSPQLLSTSQKIYMNPTFGYHSLLIGGADADMVFGTTLIDIKTTVHMNGFQDYFKQLFGYYLLSEFDKTFDASLQNLAVYLPRFDALYYIKLSVIRNLIDIDAFAKQFLELIEEYQV